MTEIPITPELPSQTFKVDLEGVTYNFRIIYNTRIGVWTLDINDENSEHLAGGIALVKGVDLVDQLKLGLGGLFKIEVGTSKEDATFAGLGVNVLLIHLTEEEIENGLTV